MERFYGSHSSIVNKQTSSYNPDSIQKTLFRLKDLRQVQDQSIKELCPVSIDEQSGLNLRKKSTYSNQQAFTHVNILKQLQESVQKDRFVEAECTVSTKRAAYNQQKDQNLLLSNLKLKQDNIKLFSECIKLRKMCQIYLGNIQQFQKKQNVQKSKVRFFQLQRSVVSLRAQVEELSSINRNLEQKIQKMVCEASGASIIINKYDKKTAECQFLSKQNSDLSKKVLNLEKQLDFPSARYEQKTLSIDSSTKQSKKSQIQKDRMITNMKIVHESEVRRLKVMIQQLRKESIKGEIGVGSRGTAKNH